MRQFVFYPIAFLIWLTLGPYLPHLQSGQIYVNDLARVLMIGLLCILMVWGILWRVLKDWKLSALFVWVSMLLFFTYRLQYEFFGDHVTGNGTVLSALMPGLIWVMACLVVYVMRNYLAFTTTVLNIAGGCLLIMLFVTLQIHSAESSPLFQTWEKSLDASSSLVQATSQEVDHAAPDIYYIILDGYARHDVLNEQYAYDNSQFLKDLEKRGFYIARHSRSNYSQTMLSLASTLNLRYLDDLPKQSGAKGSNGAMIKSLIHQNALMKALKTFGYQTIAFSSGISFTELHGADQYIVPRGTLNEWESFFLLETPIPLLMQSLFRYSLYDTHKTRLLQTFDQIPSVITTEGPHFVFAHFVAPHPPFVLGQHDVKTPRDKTFSFYDGSQYLHYYGVKSEEYVAGYTEQITILNQKIQNMIDRILRNAQRPPIIIVQADHGPGAYLDWENPSNMALKERMSILNAYYVPGKEDIGFYQDITPVNSFRVILNHYFQANLPLLPDESYFSKITQPYDFMNVTDLIEKEQSAGRNRVENLGQIAKR